MTTDIIHYFREESRTSYKLGEVLGMLTINIILLVIAWLLFRFSFRIFKPKPHVNDSLDADLLDETDL